MPLLMCDLDNTLIDREAVFGRWAWDLVTEFGGDEGDVRWLVEIDGDGYTPREVVANAVRSHFHLADEVPALVDRFRDEIASRCTPGEGVLDGLAAARAAGWALVIVTNGAPIQEVKIRAAGLDAAVDGWCVSSIEGTTKPDRLIFERAAAVVGHRLDPRDWMVGDSAEHDIVGGHEVGVSTAWMRRRRTWALDSIRPTIEVDSFAEGVTEILAMSDGDDRSGLYD